MEEFHCSIDQIVKKKTKLFIRTNKDTKRDWEVASVARLLLAQDFEPLPSREAELVRRDRK